VIPDYCEAITAYRAFNVFDNGLLCAGGGRAWWVIKFIGHGRFQTQDRTFAFATAQRATQDDRRKEFARVFGIGLAGYAANSSTGPLLDVAWRGPASALATRGIPY
jgi:hypothetical protein